MNEDKIIKILLNHSEILEKMENSMLTKEDGRKMVNSLENVATICKKIQEDHVFAVEWLKRLQNRSEIHEDDLRRIKLHLKIA